MLFFDRLLPAPTQLHRFDDGDDEDDALEAAYNGGVSWIFTAKLSFSNVIKPWVVYQSIHIFKRFLMVTT